MSPPPADCVRRAVAWRLGDDAEHPYVVDVDGRRWELRLNDFPVEPLYTLLVDGQEAGDLEEWPEAWQRPD